MSAPRSAGPTWEFPKMTWGCARILDCCPKAAGMMMLVRSMSPRVIAVDEIGDYEDIHAIETVVNCGCKLIATVHGCDMEDIRRKPLLQKLVKERFLSVTLSYITKGCGGVREIMDERGSILYEGRRGG